MGDTGDTQVMDMSPIAKNLRAVFDEVAEKLPAKVLEPEVAPKLAAMETEAAKLVTMETDAGKLVTMEAEAGTMDAEAGKLVTMEAEPEPWTQRPESL